MSIVGSFRIKRRIQWKARPIVHSSSIYESRIKDIISNNYNISIQDPVCGGAHCALAPYWSKKLGKCDFNAYQVLFFATL